MKASQYSLIDMINDEDALSHRMKVRNRQALEHDKLGIMTTVSNNNDFLGLNHFES